MNYLYTGLFFCLLLLTASEGWSLPGDSLNKEKTSRFQHPLRSQGPEGIKKVNRGWVPGKGNGFFKLAQSVIRAGNFYTPSGDRVPITTTSLYISSLYAEYGLSNRITATLYLPFFFRSTLNEIQFEPSGETIPGDSFNGLGDMNVGIKVGLIQNSPFVLSTSLTLGIPIGEPSGGDTELLQSGDGEFNQLVELQFGYAIPNTRAYIGGNVGVNNRTNGFSEEFRYGFEGGYTFGDKLTALLKVDGVESFMNGDAEGAINGIFSNNTEYLSITPEVLYFVKGGFGVTANAAFAVFGKRILADPQYSFGVFFKLEGKQ